MTDVEATIRAALDAAGHEALECALVGGFAVSVRAEPRFTQDVDLAVAVESDVEAESLVRRFLGDGHELVATVEQDAVGRVATARLRLAGGDLLDLLFASSGIEREVVADAEVVEVVPGLDVPVAATGHLIALKLLSRSDERPLDQADLIALMREASAGEIARAQRSIGLIETRGFARGRDLAAGLTELIASHGH